MRITRITRKLIALATALHCVALRREINNASGVHLKAWVRSEDLLVQQQQAHLDERKKYQRFLAVDSAVSQELTRIKLG